MPNRTRVAVVDDHPLFREGVTVALRSAPDLEMVDQGTTARDAVRICEDQKPDIVLIDLGIPGSGTKAARQLLDAGTAVKIVIVTASEREDDIAALTELGVSGYIVKGCSGRDLLEVLRLVQTCSPDTTPVFSSGNLQLRSRHPVALATEQNRERPENREKQILTLVAKGMTNKEIARTLNLSERSVKYHVGRILETLDAPDRLNVALISRR